jgi:hypothetical protein
MPIAHLRGLPGPLFQEWECSVCKVRFPFRCENLSDAKSVREQKTVLSKEWDEHLQKEHRRQWDSSGARRTRGFGDEIILSRITERTFIILRYKYKVPAMASCAKCQQKFFTPHSYDNDLLGAERYLRHKFEEHRCREEAKGNKS